MKKVIKYGILYALYILFLSLCYKNYLVQVYGYYGFKNNITGMSICISAVLLFITFIYIVKQKTYNYSTLIVYILIIINFIPSVITYMFMPIQGMYILLLSLYWMFMVIFINSFNKIHFKSKNAMFKSNIVNIYILLLIELFIIGIVLVRYTGISLSFSDVYDLRDNFFQSRVPTILAYLFAALKVINPLFFIYLYNKKKKFGATCSFLLQFLAFLADGSKSTLFSIVIAYVIVKVLANKKEVNLFENSRIKDYILIGVVSINIIGFFEYRLLNSSVLYNYFIRRLFFVPSLLNQCYFDFFTQNPYDFFRQSFIGKLGFPSPYNGQIQKIISAVYFSTPDMLANNGLFSDAYMNLGAIGVVVMPALICFAFRVLDHCSKMINPFYLLTIMVSVSYIFISSSFFTVLLTHGFILLCLIMRFIIPREKELN